MLPSQKFTTVTSAGSYHATTQRLARCFELPRSSDGSITQFVSSSVSVELFSKNLVENSFIPCLRFEMFRVLVSVRLVPSVEYLRFLTVSKT